MKKVLFAILTVSLIVLAVTPAACSNKESAPVDYSVYNLQDVSFSYPTEWIDGTAELEEDFTAEDREYMSAAGWYTESDSAALFAMAIDMEAAGMPDDYTMTESEKEEFATLMIDYITIALDQPTIVSQSETTISGQWAYETEFSGEIEGIDAKGYLLMVMSDDTVFMLMFASQNNVWDDLKEVYDMAKYTTTLY